MCHLGVLIKPAC